MTLDYQQLSWVWYIDDNLGDGPAAAVEALVDVKSFSTGLTASDQLGCF